MQFHPRQQQHKTLVRNVLIQVSHITIEYSLTLQFFHSQLIFQNVEQDI